MNTVCNCVHSVLSLMVHCQSSRNGFSATENKLDRVLEGNIEKICVLSKVRQNRFIRVIVIGYNETPQNEGSNDGIYKAQTTRPECWSTSSTPSSEHEAHARDLLLRKNLDPLQGRGVQSKLEAASWHKTISDAAPSQQELIH